MQNVQNLYLSLTTSQIHGIVDSAVREKTLKYNPFSELLHNKYDPTSLEDVDDLLKISKILQNCGRYNIANFKKLSKETYTKNRTFSLVFLIILMDVHPILIHLFRILYLSTSTFSQLLELQKPILINVIKIYID